MRKIISCKLCKKVKEQHAKGFCNECYKKVWQRKNRVKLNEYQKIYQMENIDKVKEWQKKSYKNNKERINKYRKEYGKEWRKKNKCRINEYSRLYQHNKRLVLKWDIHGDRIDYKTFKKLKERDKKCVYCNSDGKMTIDHIVPISMGGSNKYDNLVLCCKKCNSSKNDKDVFSWCKEKNIKIPSLIVESIC